jgi:hypothetical protein
VGSVIYHLPFSFVALGRHPLGPNSEFFAHAFVEDTLAIRRVHAPADYSQGFLRPLSRFVLAAETHFLQLQKHIFCLTLGPLSRVVS